MNSDNRILVGDVGGTHARIAIMEGSDAGPWRILQRLDLAERFPTFEDALRSYLERAGVTRLPPRAAIAVAGPVVAGTARFTNRGWDISEQALRQVGFERALLINDFAALALAVDLLNEDHLHAIGSAAQRGSRAEPSPSSAPVRGSACPVSRASAIRSCRWPLRAGHMGFAPSNSEELAALQLMCEESVRVSIERILSGQWFRAPVSNAGAIGRPRELPAHGR